MFLTKFLNPTIVFGSSGGSSGGGGGSSRSSSKKSPSPSSASKSSSGGKGGNSNANAKASQPKTETKPSTLAPKTSPRPVARPTVTNTYQGPNMDGSAGYKATYSTVTSPVDSNGYLKSGPDRVTTMDNKEITNVGKTIGGKDYSSTASVTAPAPTSAPDTSPVTAPETVDPRNGVGGGRDGGGTAKRNASQAQEDNVAVKRQAAGVDSYKSDAPAGVKEAAANRRRRNSMAISKNN